MKLAVLLTSTLFLLALTYSNASLKIISPENLMNSSNVIENYEISYQIARYGDIPYGSNLIGTVILADPILGCNIGNRTVSDNIHKPVHVPIFIMRRGGCKFVMKSRYAQLAGAKLLIIVDSEGEPLDHTFGGSTIASDIHIPTILISNDDGNAIISYLENIENNPEQPNDGPVLASISFPEPPTNSKLILDFWFSTSDPTGQVYDFLKDFKSHYYQVGDYVTFNPHYITWQCQSCKANGFTQPEHDCVSAGRYCAPDPDASGPLTGVNVVFENLRQLCILNTDSDLWWKYVSNFGEKCKNKPDQELCSKKLLSDIGTHSATYMRIEECIHGSFKTDIPPVDEKINDNTILAEEWAHQESNDISLSPSIFMNHDPYHGSVDGTSVLKVLCEKLESEPRMCNQFNAAQTLSVKTILIAMGIMILMILLILYFYRRMQRREMTKEMSLQVSQIMSQYLELADNRA